jgi:transposase
VEATGIYHESLIWYLFQEDQSVSVVLPNRAKAYCTSIGIKSKNDKIDAKGLAMMGAGQKLTAWKPISKKIYTLRQLTRHLEDLQQIKTSLTNQREASIHSMYQNKKVNSSIQKVIKTLDKQIEDCKKSIQQILDQDIVLKKKIGHITSIKGVADLTAVVVVAETNGFALINNSKQLISYAGYDIKENQSGARVGKTRITKKGNAHIRRAMHFPAFNAVRYEKGIFANLYERVYQRNNIKMKGYVAVQAKLLKIIYALWKNNTDYDPEYLEKTSKKKAAALNTTAARDKSLALYEETFSEALKVN